MTKTQQNDYDKYVYSIALAFVSQSCMKQILILYTENSN